MLIKLEWLGCRMVKKLWQYSKPFSSDTGMLRTDRRTDGRTDIIAISISHVSVLTRDKKLCVSPDGVNFGRTGSLSRFRACDGFAGTGILFVNPLTGTLNPQSTDHYTAIRWLVHWPLMGELLHLVQPGRDAAPPSPFLAVPNVTAHPSTASVPT